MMQMLHFEEQKDLVLSRYSGDGCIYRARVESIYQKTITVSSKMSLSFVLCINNKTIYTRYFTLTTEISRLSIVILCSNGIHCATIFHSKRFFADWTTFTVYPRPQQMPSSNLSITIIWPKCARSVYCK